MSDEADREDVRRVLAGDTEAFEGIVARWQGPLVNLGWRYCRDRDRAQELAQDAFVRAFRALGSWRGEGAFSTWLFAIALNVFRSAVRRDPPLTTAGPVDVADPFDPAAAHDARELQAGIRRAVLALPERYRDAVIVFYFQEMNIGDAARTLGVPEGTLKARLSRGRDLLRRRMQAFIGPRKDVHGV
jgi:RNA polymerase sigma-70 factor (ECF subfamily)